MILAIKCIGIILGGFLLVVLGAAIIDAIHNRHSTSDDPKYRMVEEYTEGDYTFHQDENKGVFHVTIWKDWDSDEKRRLYVSYNSQQAITDIPSVKKLFEEVMKDDRG